MSAAFSLPGQSRSKDATPEALGRAGSGDTRQHIGPQFAPGVRGCAGGVFADLGPDEFRGIELGSRGGEGVDLNPRMTLQKAAHLNLTMNGMLVPHQNNGTRNDAEQVSQKNDDLFSVDRFSARMQMQPDPTLARREAQRPDQIQALVVLDARTNRWGLPTRGPRSLERRDERKARFIDENQSRPKLMPLFLSVARCDASSVRWLRHRGSEPGAGAFDNSSPSVAASATRRWVCSGCETGPRSGA